MWKRARTKKQKKSRKEEIIEATSYLYENHIFSDITFALIARKSNFTRSNLYKYFNNKEEIFLELLLADIIKWRKTLNKELKEPFLLNKSIFL